MPAAVAPPSMTAASHDAASRIAFLDSFKDNRHALLQPPTLISTSSFQWTKQALDAVAGQVSDEQQAARQLEQKNKKRKREGGFTDVLKIRKLHVDGFETGQVWQQAKRIIASTLSTSQDVLQEVEESDLIETEAEVANGAVKVMQFDEEGSEIGSDDEASASDGSAESESDDEAEFEDAESELDEAEISGEDMEVDLDEDGEEVDLKDDDEDGEEEEEDDEFNLPTETYTEDADGLNDGFFSLEEFNKQSQWFEAQDAKADPNTDLGDDDDEEEINWAADPMTAPEGNTQAKKPSKDDEDLDDASDIENPEAEDDDDAGPTFGDMADEEDDASDDEMAGALEDGITGDMGMDLTANDIFYKDFFVPPARKAKKGEKPRKPYVPKHMRPDEGDMERAMADVRRDIFEDLSENSEDDDALSDVSAGNPKSRKSAHERRQMKLAEEIRKMESELVAKRAWTLSGEAAAQDRPKNSLLEQDLDFEHAGKPVPVATEEISEDLEDLIKRRIIAGEFDELVKRRPGGDLPADTRRGLVELEDTKGKKSLAELYEEEHVKNTNPDYVNKDDEKMRKEEKEIESMWSDVSAKLDALSSWQYKPKPAAASLTVVADVATIAMEDAQPTTAQGVAGGESMIAPQEVYNPTKDAADKSEVVGKSGLPVARQELTREETLRRRRREKERIKKAGPEASKLGKKAQQKKDTVAELKRGNVKVINKKGEVLDMDGKKPQAARAVTSSGFKL